MSPVAPPEEARYAPARPRPTHRRAGPLSDPSIVELSIAECLEMLRSCEIGRIAVVIEGGFPVVLPVHHVVAETEQGQVGIYLRTRTGNVVDSAPEAVAFQVDGFDATRREGWSVLVRGWLRHLESNRAHPVGDQLIAAGWLTERHSLVVIEPVEITGRRLRSGELDWPFHPDAYL